MHIDGCILLAAVRRTLNMASATSKNATRDFLTIQTPNSPRDKYYIFNAETNGAYQYKRKYSASLLELTSAPLTIIYGQVKKLLNHWG